MYTKQVAIFFFFVLTKAFLIAADHDHHDHIDVEWFARRNMNLARSDMTATLNDDAIYVIGGCAENQIYINETHAGQYPGYYCGFFEGVTNRAEKYEPETDTWTTLADAPRKRYRHAAVNFGDFIYIFGGVNDTDQDMPEVDIYDTRTDTWTTSDVPMTNPVRDLAAL